MQVGKVNFGMRAISLFLAALSLRVVVCMTLPGYIRHEQRLKRSTGLTQPETSGVKLFQNSKNFSSVGTSLFDQYLDLSFPVPNVFSINTTQDKLVELFGSKNILRDTLDNLPKSLEFSKTDLNSQSKVTITTTPEEKPSLSATSTPITLSSIIAWRAALDLSSGIPNKEDIPGTLLESSDAASHTLLAESVAPTHVPKLLRSSLSKLMDLTCAPEYFPIVDLSSETFVRMQGPAELLKKSSFSTRCGWRVRVAEGQRVRVLCPMFRMPDGAVFVARDMDTNITAMYSENAPLRNVTSSSNKLFLGLHMTDSTGPAVLNCFARSLPASGPASDGRGPQLQKRLGTVLVGESKARLAKQNTANEVMLPTILSAIQKQSSNFHFKPTTAVTSVSAFSPNFIKEIVRVRAPSRVTTGFTAVPDATISNPITLVPLSSTVPPRIWITHTVTVIGTAITTTPIKPSITKMLVATAMDEKVTSLGPALTASVTTFQRQLSPLTVTANPSAVGNSGTQLFSTSTFPSSRTSSINQKVDNSTEALDDLIVTKTIERPAATKIVPSSGWVYFAPKYNIRSL